MDRGFPTTELPDGGQDWKLPRGPHKLPPQVVNENQRSRLLAAAARAVAEHGYASLTVEQVIGGAGVSRSTFYANFEDKQDCVRAAHGEVFDRLSSRIFRACASQLDWPDKVAAAVRTAIDFAIESPQEARLLLFDSVGADPELAARVLASNEHLIGLLRAGRDYCTEAAELPELAERALIGAITSVVGNRLMQDQADRLREIEAEVVQLMLVPYVGTDDARQIAAAG